MGLRIPVLMNTIFNNNNNQNGGEFDPASITSATLHQFLFNKTAISGSTVFDESTNKGSARAVQLGKAYLFDGTNDFVNYASANLPFLNDASLGWSAEFNFNPSSVTGVRVLFSKQLASGNFRGVAVYTDGATLRFNLLNNNVTNALYVQVNGFVPVVGQDYSVRVIYNGSKLGTGVTWVINGVAYTSTIITSTLTINDINSGTPFNVGASNGSFFFIGKLWGLKLFNAAGVLQFFAKCDEGAGVISYDSSGNNYHGTITNATLSSFHSTQNIYSYQNEVGYRFGINLVRYSEVFSNAYWSKNTGTTISGNTITAPDGSLTADSLIEASGAQPRHGIFNTLSPTISGNHTLSIYVKNRSGSRYLRMVLNGELSANLVYADFDLVNGVISKAITATGTFTAGSAIITPVGDGWYRCSISGSGVITYGTYAISNVPAAATGTDFGYVSYTGDGVSGFYIWGGQLSSGTALLEYFRTDDYATESTGLFSPRNEASPLLAINGQPLQFTGRVPYNAALEQSNCLSFDGTNDYVNVNNATLAAYSGTFSIAWKMNMSSLAVGFRRIFSTRAVTNGIDILIETSGAFQYFNGVGSQTTIAGLIIAGQEQSFVLTSNGTTTRLYLNGVLVDTRTYGFNTVGATCNIGFGASNYFIGTMWDFRLFKRELSAPEALTIHEGGEVTGDLDLHLPMSNGAGNIVYDISGNNRHGALINGTTWAKQNNYHANIKNGFSKYMSFDGNNNRVTLPIVVTGITNATFRCKISTNDTNGVIMSDGADFLLLWQQGSGLAANTNVGTPSVTINGVPFTGTRGDLYNVLSDGNVKDIVVTNLNMTNLGTVNLMYFSDGSGFTSTGIMWDVSLDLTSDGNIDHRYNGYGNLNSNWLDLVGSANGTVFGSPTTILVPAKSASLDVFNEPLRSPAGIYHNGAETLIDFTNNVLSPQAVVNSWETAWAFNTARVNPEFDRTLTQGGVDHRMDRALAYSTALSGGDLTKVQNFTATRAL